MKVYTKVVIDMGSGQVLQEESYEYAGEVTETKGGSEPSEPDKPDPAEARLRQAQTELATFQLTQAKMGAKERAALYPIMLEAAGYTTDEEGNLIKRDLTEAEQQLEEIGGLHRQRQLSALKGELDVDPALEARLGLRKKELINRLRTEKGHRFAETTGGIAALAKFEQTAGLLRGASRRAELTSGEQFLLSSPGMLSQYQQQQVQPFMQLATFSRQGPTLSQAASGLLQAQQPYQFQRELTKSRYY